MAEGRNTDSEREPGARPPVAAQIERALLDAGLTVAVEDDGRTVRLDGRVDTPEARQAASDIVRALAGDRRLANDLEVEEVWPTTAAAADDEAASLDRPMLADAPGGAADDDAELEPDFTDQALETSPVEMAGEAGATFDPMPDGETVFFPPTDPVIGIADDGNIEVLGGFSPTAIEDEDNVPRSALDGQIGDEAIADAVRRALRRDAMTTDLTLTVRVREGVVHLRGTVPTLDDAESAEEVAGRVPGVEEVVDETDVAAL